MTTDDERARRGRSGVAVIAPNWLGDLVMSAGAVAALRRAAGEERVDVFVPVHLAPLARAVLRADRVVGVRLRRGLERLRARARLAAFIRSGGYRTVVVLPNSPGSALVAWLSGAPERVGTATHWRSFLLTETVGPAGADEHEADVFSRVARAAVRSGFDERPGDRALSVPGAARSRAGEILGRLGLDASRESFLVISPGAAYGPAKQYGIESFAAVAREVSARGLRPVIDGSAKEAALCEEVAQGAADARPVVTAGKTGLLDLAGLLALAAGFAGNDSGAAHLSAAIGTPTAALYMSTDPRRCSQRGAKVRLLVSPVDCRPCARRTCRRGTYECRDTVKPDEVVSALRELGAFERKPR